jgi:H+/Cl- antiporter ClcA
MSGSLRDAVAQWGRRALLEHGTLAASLLKWTLLATATGLLAGASTAVFLALLGITTRWVAATPAPLALLPFGFLVSYLLVHWLAPDAEGHGTDKVIEAVHRRWGHIPLAVAPVKLAATVVTIACGGSVGKEGPAAQIGASFASALGSALFLRRGDHRKLVICGIGAGFAAVFGTPIAGAIFGVEVLVMGSLFYEVLYPSFVAGLVSYLVATHLGVVYVHQTLTMAPVTEALLLRAIVAGVVFGLVALVLIEALHLADRLTRALPLPRWAIALGGGGALAGLGWLVSPRYLGLGVDTLESTLHGAAVPADAWLWKSVFTAISLACGGSGGIVTPIFFVGATAGSTLGHILGFDRSAFAAVGMVSVLAAAANAPIAAAVMAIEMFGPAIGPYAAISAVVSFVMVGHRSVYGSQLIGIVKSGSLVAPAGLALDALTVLERRRRASRRKALMRALRRRASRRRAAGD